MKLDQYSTYSVRIHLVSQIWAESMKTLIPKKSKAVIFDDMQFSDTILIVLSDIPRRETEIHRLLNMCPL